MLFMLESGPSFWRLLHQLANESDDDIAPLYKSSITTAMSSEILIPFLGLALTFRSVHCSTVQVLTVTGLILANSDFVSEISNFRRPSLSLLLAQLMLS